MLLAEQLCSIKIFIGFLFQESVRKIVNNYGIAAMDLWRVPDSKLLAQR
jgi:hypothetical protein